MGSSSLVRSEGCKQVLSHVHAAGIGTSASTVQIAGSYVAIPVGAGDGDEADAASLSRPVNGFFFYFPSISIMYRPAGRQVTAAVLRRRIT